LAESPSTPQRLISASRRTDLPGYHPDACAERLLRLRKPFHSVFFWTRYPRGLIGPGLLADVIQTGIENPFVNLTVTGLGGTRFEPRVPPTAEILGQLEPLIRALKDDPRRILWRFDPLLKGVMSLDSFDQLAVEMSRVGVKTCITSFPSTLSLKGSLEEQYARHGILRWSRQEKRELALGLKERAERRGLRLMACNQPKLVQDTAGAVEPAACISAELAQALHPRGWPLDLPKDPSQRRHCNCSRSDDIGRYDDLCRSGCVYCYSSAGGPRPGG